jgi:hypothetical protein
MPDLYTYPEPPQPVSWHAHAACNGHPDPDLWHTDTAGPIGARRTDEAKRVCRACPVEVRCLAEHINEPHGVWGGLDPRERREQTRRLTVERGICGTDTGYQWHQRLNEHQCQPCKQAHSDRTNQIRGRAHDCPMV